MAQSPTSVAEGSAWHVRDAAKVAATLRVWILAAVHGKPMSPAPYEKACEEAACGRRGDQSRSDAAAPAALPPPRERGHSRLLCRGRGMLRPSERPASLITKQVAAPMIGAAGPWAPARAAPTTIAAPISAGIA